MASGILDVLKTQVNFKIMAIIPTTINPEVGAILMGLSSISVILNSLRLYKTGKE